MRLEENLIHACVKHMNNCVKRIEQLKSLKIDENFENQIKPLIAKEIEGCINEYLRTYTYLTQKLKEFSNAPLIESAADIEESINMKGVHYKLLLKLLQRDGVINQVGMLTKKGSKLLEQETIKESKKSDIPYNLEPCLFEERALIPQEVPLKPDESDFSFLEDIKTLKKKSGRERIYNAVEFDVDNSNDQNLTNGDQLEALEDDDILEQFEVLRSLKKEIQELDVKKEVPDLEDELKYLLEHRKEVESHEEDNIVICPKCLSKVELKEICEVCGKSLIQEKLEKVEVERSVLQVDLEAEQVTPTIEIMDEPPKAYTYMHEGEAVVQKQDFIEEAPVKEINITKSNDYELLGGFVSYFTITQGVLMLSGSLFIILLSTTSYIDSSRALADLLFSMVDAFPGVPFSFEVLRLLSFWQRISLIAVFGIAVTLLGVGLWRGYPQAKIAGAILFTFASLIDIYNILIIDVSTTLMPFYGLIINVVIIYLLMFRLVFTKKVH